MMYNHQPFHPAFTSWHITWGTYGTRLHGGPRATVDRDHNRRGAPFVGQDSLRERSEQSILNFPAKWLTTDQRAFIEDAIPSICERGGWRYRICAAGEDHVHVLCDVQHEIHGEKVRRLLKRWIGQALSAQWPLAAEETWWAEEGSNIAVKDDSYLKNVYQYILRQRATPVE
jgi:REP element-mobilizing transposase RayT